MAQEFARPFYKSRAWQKCRESYIKRAGGLCEECLAQGQYTPGTEVHHIQELTPDNIGDPAVTLNYDNLRLLCHNCHSAHHHRRQRRYVVDPSTGRATTPPLVSENI